jgi:hypothetical protein
VASSSIYSYEYADHNIDQEKAESKAARRAEKEAEKSRKAEEKQARKEDKRKSKEVKRDVEDATKTSAATRDAEKPSTAYVPGAALLGTDEHSKIKDEDKDVDTDRTPAVDTEDVANSDGAALDKTNSPDMMTRVTTGGTVHSTQSGLRPELDRHVSTVVSSSSSSARSSLSLSSIDEDDNADAVASKTVPVTASEPAAAIVLPPVVATSGNAAESVPVGRTAPAATASDVTFQGRKPGRMSGIFSRFNRKTKPAEKSQQTATTAATVPSTDAKKSLSTSEPSTTGTGTAAEAPVTSDAVSDSSFRRHDTDLHSISSVSSDEQLPTTRPTARRGRSSVSAISGDEDEFEEARDHFDETLAPPPTFGGQQKTQSPARETKFQEEF